MHKHHFAILAALAGSVLGNHNDNNNYLHELDGHTTAFPDRFPGDGAPYTPLNPGFMQLPTVEHTIDKWPTGQWPEGCYDVARGSYQGQSHCPNVARDLEVYNVTYVDCPVPSILCRCRDSGTSIEQLANIFGKVPLATRQVTRTVSNHLAGGCGGSVNGADLWVWGQCANDMTVLFHELTHNLDCQVGTPNPSGPGLGNMWSWVDPNYLPNLHKDTCMPTQYSRTNKLEHFAEVGVLVAWDRNVQKLSEYPGKPTSCMSNSLTQADAVLQKYFQRTPSGQQCTQAMKQGRIYSEADLGKEGGGVALNEEYAGIEMIDAAAVIAKCYNSTVIGLDEHRHRN